MVHTEEKEFTSKKPSVDELIAALFPPPSTDGTPVPDVYAILDGARDPRIFKAIYDSGLEYECLLTGDLSTELMEAAPYLVHLKKDSPFVRMILEKGWGNSWGIYLWTKCNIDRLWQHCRSLLQVQDEQGRKMYFRFYDPRVMRVYWPTCIAQERQALLGPIEHIVLEGIPAQILSHSQGEDLRAVGGLQC